MEQELGDNTFHVLQNNVQINYNFKFLFIFMCICLNLEAKRTRKTIFYSFLKKNIAIF